MDWLREEPQAEASQSTHHPRSAVSSALDAEQIEPPGVGHEAEYAEPSGNSIP